MKETATLKLSETHFQDVICFAFFVLIIRDSRALYTFSYRISSPLPKFCPSHVTSSGSATPSLKLECQVLKTGGSEVSAGELLLHNCCDLWSANCWLKVGLPQFCSFWGCFDKADIGICGPWGIKVSWLHLGLSQLHAGYSLKTFLGSHAPRSRQTASPIIWRCPNSA